MKRMLFKMMIAMACIAVSINVYAYSFEVDGIYYNYISSSDKTVEVAPKEISVSDYANIDAYSGVVNIPEQVTYNDITYNVVAIGEAAFSRCSGLEEVIIPNTIQTIGIDAFYQCAN